MLSSEGKPTDTSAAIANQKQFKTIGTDGASSLTPNQQEQIFQLIESILCFEACLYHQVLPLKLEDNNLVLGIVNPTDAAALDYVNGILSYLKSTLETQSLTAETHRVILSEYLNYKNRSAEVSKLASNQREEVENQSFLENLEEEFEPGDNTLILFDFPKGVDLESFSHIQEPNIPLTTPLNRQELDENIGVSIFEVISADNLPALRLPLPESFSADALLSTLAPKKLLKELLARILAGGIGRLYLERQPYQGRILWSLNGIVQSVIEELPLSTFQGVLNELKRLNSLTIATLGQAKQVETECLFQQQRLLLRLRVMPGMYGEEATLQVLRGAALKFYQQQQLTRLSRDALGASQQLSYKVHELQQKLALNKRDLNLRQLEALNALNELVESLDSHLRILTDIPTV
ncbi:MAG: pilus assembly protein PilB [Rivularia sp. (in: cyanobacteria)]